MNETLAIAPRRKRIVAFLIDHFTLTFLMTAAFFSIIGPNYLDENNQGQFLVVLLMVALPGMIIYVAKDSIQGISLGKWIMGIMVRNYANPQEVPSVFMLIVRNLFVFIWPVEFIAMLISTDKRRLGDRVAKTIVIDNPGKPSRTPRVVALVGVIAAFVVFMVLFVAVALKSSDAYKTAVHEIEMNQEILEETGGIKGYGLLPSGNITISNGKGDAQLQIKVIGDKKDIEVNVHLTKEIDGQWMLLELKK